MTNINSGFNFSVHFNLSQSLGLKVSDVYDVIEGKDCILALVLSANYDVMVICYRSNSSQWELVTDFGSQASGIGYGKFGFNKNNGIKVSQIT